MSVIKCHQQFRAAAKCTESPMQACLREGWKCILGWTGRPSVADSSNKVAESRRSRRVCGLSPERREKAAAKCTGSPMQACLQEGWKCIFEPGTQGKMQRTHPRNEDPYAT